MIGAGLSPGTIVWVGPSPAQGREQSGERPALVVASAAYLASVEGLAIVVPITSVERGWPHHVLVAGPRVRLAKRSFAMTEQPRTISRERVTRQAGSADASTMAEVLQWLRDFLAGT